MWQNKRKAVTFSFDDGVTQDIRALEIINRYGLKCTFNLNSSLLGLRGELDIDGRKISHDKVQPSEVKSIYAGHEIAVHTLTHPFLPAQTDETVVWQVEKDRKTLEALVGYDIVGMAYPCGGKNNDDRIASVIGAKTKIRYARTVVRSHSFAMQENLLRFNPTCWYSEDCVFELADAFLADDTDEPKLFYIGGHTYEMDAELITWDNFERLCEKLAGRSDVFYGTNRECLLGE